MHFHLAKAFVELIHYRRLGVINQDLIRPGLAVAQIRHHAGFGKVVVPSLLVDLTPDLVVVFALPFRTDHEAAGNRKQAAQDMRERAGGRLCQGEKLDRELILLQMPGPAFQSRLSHLLVYVEVVNRGTSACFPGRVIDEAAKKQHGPLPGEDFRLDRVLQLHHKAVHHTRQCF